MNEEELRNIVRDTIGQQIREDVDSALIFKYVSDLENENKQLREIIYKIEEILKNKRKLYMKMKFGENWADYEELAMQLDEEISKVIKEAKGEISNI